MSVTRRGTILGAGAAALAMTAGAPPLLFEEEGYAGVPGGRVWWRRVGVGPKTPVLTLHGGPGAGHNYLLPLAALAADRPVIFYDQLGCGKADSPHDESLYTIQRSVDEVDAVRHALGLERIVLYGHSWGSMLAIEYMCQGRGRGVEQLVLGGALASAPQFVAGTRRLIDAMPDGAGARLRALEAAGKTDGDEYNALVLRFYQLHVCRRLPWPPEVLETTEILSKSIAYRVMNGPNEFTITGVIKDWDRRADLKRLPHRTLITTGEFDEVTLDCAQTINDAVIGSSLEVFPGLSHLTMNESPEAYVGAVGKYIAG